MARTLAQELSSAIVAAQNCAKSGNATWQVCWERRVNELMAELPSGSGIDAGVSVVWDKCSDRQITLACEFHHMNDAGMYDGWTSHTLTIRPTFGGLDIRVSGRNRNDIKDYLADAFLVALDTEVPSYMQA